MSDTPDRRVRVALVLLALVATFLLYRIADMSVIPFAQRQWFWHHSRPVEARVLDRREITVESPRRRNYQAGQLRVAFEARDPQTGQARTYTHEQTVSRALYRASAERQTVRLRYAPADPGHCEIEDPTLDAAKGSPLPVILLLPCGFGLLFGVAYTLMKRSGAIEEAPPSRPA
jgi:hypothetical protein